MFALVNTKLSGSIFQIVIWLWNWSRSHRRSEAQILLHFFLRPVIAQLPVYQIYRNEVSDLVLGWPIQLNKMPTNTHVSKDKIQFVKMRIFVWQLI